MSSISSYLLHFCRSSANAINVPSIPKKSTWPFSNLFSDNLSSKHLVIASRLCSDKRDSSKNTSNSVTGNNSKSHNSDGSNKDLSEGALQEDTFFTNDSAFGTKENKGLASGCRPFFNPEGTEENMILDYELQPPTNCCMSGCPNCVWLDYVEELTKRYANPELSREKILKELDSMEDQNIKAFIMMELRTRKLI